MSVKGNATTHSSRANGHGQKVSRQRFAIKTTGLVRGMPLKSKTAPWFLKSWGSRPEKALPVVLALVA